MRRAATHEVRAAMLGAHRRCAFRILLVLLRIRDVDQRDDIRAHRTPPLNLGSTKYSPPVLGPLVPPPVRPAHRSPPGTIARLRRGRQGSLGLCAGGPLPASRAEATDEDVVPAVVGGATVDQAAE